MKANINIIVLDEGFNSVSTEIPTCLHTQACASWITVACKRALSIETSDRLTLAEDLVFFN